LELSMMQASFSFVQSRKQCIRAGDVLGPISQAASEAMANAASDAARLRAEISAMRLGYRI
jgi:hypothetical protein